MATNSELRARARANLGGSVFHNNWLMGLLVCLVGSAIANCFPLLLAGPISFGLAEVFLKQARGNAEIHFSDLFTGFSRFGACFKLFFFQSLFVFLWGLIPIAGIVFAIRKGYSYALSFYIQADNPEMDWREVLDRSSFLMEGHRWELFCLQLSFLGWILLGCVSFGVVTLWVDPYMRAATANFYDEHRLCG